MRIGFYQIGHRSDRTGKCRRLSPTRFTPVSSRPRLPCELGIRHVSGFWIAAASVVGSIWSSLPQRNGLVKILKSTKQNMQSVVICCSHHEIILDYRPNTKTFCTRRNRNKYTEVTKSTNRSILFPHCLETKQLQNKHILKRQKKVNACTEMAARGFVAPGTKVCVAAFLLLPSTRIVNLLPL